MGLQLFDTVYRKQSNGGINFGICIIENSDGSVIVAWHPDGKKETLSATDKKHLRLSDRFFHPGEFILGPEDRLGYVKSVQMRLDLSILGTDLILNGVDSQRLERVQVYRPGDIILYRKNWVGEVVKVKRSVMLRVEGQEQMDSGKIVDWDILASTLNGNEDPFRRQDVFYPGLEMKSCCWKSSDLTDLEFGKSYVDEVFVDELEVAWLNSIQIQEDLGTKEKPDRLIGREEISGLDRLKPFDNLAVQLGSIRLMRFNEQDTVLDKATWVKNPFGNASGRPVHSIPVMTNKSFAAVEVMHTVTNVTILWADKPECVVLQGILLKRFPHQGLNLYPSGYVQDENMPGKVGVVVEMNLKKCVATVGYFGIGIRQIQCFLENVPLYNIRPHPDIQFRPGTIVTFKKNDEDSLPCHDFGYVLSHDVNNFKINVSTKDCEVSEDFYNLKSLALRYPTYHFSKLRPISSETGLVDDVEVQGCGVLKQEIQKVIKDFNWSGLVHICHKVPVEHGFFNDIPISCQTDVDRIKMRLRHEFKLLTTMADILKIKGFSNRMHDLYSIMIRGKVSRSPYSNFIFIFDVYIPPEYPVEPPRFRLFTTSSGLLSPFISKDGFLEIPILNPCFWSSNFTLETILQMMLDIVFVPMPALIPEIDDDDELDLDNLVETVKTLMDSPIVPPEVCRYNEALFINLLTYAESLINKPPSYWKDEVSAYFLLVQTHFDGIMSWMEERKDVISNDNVLSSDKGDPFKILPISEGGVIAIKQRLRKLKDSISLPLIED